VSHLLGGLRGALRDAAGQEGSGGVGARVCQRCLIPPQCLRFATRPPQQIGPYRRHGARPGQPRIVGNAVQSGKPGAEAVAKPDGQGAISPHHRRVGDLQQPVVGRADRRPVAPLVHRSKTP